MTLDDYLRSTRLSEAAFARTVGTSQSTINRIRRQRRRVPLTLAQRIAEATQGLVDAAELATARPRHPGRTVEWSEAMLARVLDGADRGEAPAPLARAVGVSREALAAALLRLLQAERQQSRAAAPGSPPPS